jgi:transcription elongation GreA/GreB family factor/very-short-patch-repair endonuclease
MKKDKYLQIFNYLKEFSKLRSNPVRDIDAQETQYPEKFWLNDIPENELFENIIKPNFNEENDYWLKVGKPKEPVKPEFSKLSENLEKWIEKPTLLNEEDLPKLKETLEIYGKTFSIEDFPEIEKELHQYIDKKWIDDLIEYNEKIHAYRIEHENFEKLNAVYKQFFRIFNKTHQFGEEYELVVGVGLLNYKENEEKPKIFRHILTQKVDINFEYLQKDSEIFISPNLESAPQIETDSILDLFDLFDSQNIIDAEKSIEKYLKEKNIETIFSNTEDILQMFAERVSPDGSYNHLIEKPNRTPSKPNITFSPALLLRKRNTRSFTALYEKILENIENGDDRLEIPTINDLIGVHPNIQEDNSSLASSSSGSQIEPIYFTKEYNDEQLEIIEKAKRYNKVLVQGPPGTGKSHTIANLICHLLANGKKVLVTAYTKRALEVLKDKLPPEFQDLAVNLLSGDSSSIQDLQLSVNAINDELSRANLTQYQFEIYGFENELEKTKELIAKTSNNLLSVKEKATRKQEINEKYKGTLTEIAENLEKDALLYKWYQDDFGDIENVELLSSLTKFIQLHENYKQIETNEYDCEIPDPNKLLTSIQFKEYSSYTDKLANSSFPKDENHKISCSDFEQLFEQLNKLQNVYNEVDLCNIDFTSTVVESYLKGRNHEWLQRLNQSKSALEKFKKHDLRQIDQDIEVFYPQDKSLKQLKKDAQILLAYLNEGNLLTGFTFSIKKPFLPIEIKERLYFIESVRVNGSPCYTTEEYEIVLKDISIQQDFIELSQIWGKEVPKRSLLSMKISFFKEIHIEVQRLSNLIEEANSLKSHIESISNLQITLFDREYLKNAIQIAIHSRISESVSQFKDLVNQSKAYLNRGNFHSIKENVLEAYDKLDYHIYDELLSKINNLIYAKENYINFRNIRSVVYSELPFTVKSVEENLFSVQDAQNLIQAIYFRNAQHQLQKLMDVDYENQLLQNLNELEQKERKLTAKLASKKAWNKVIEGLQQNRSLRQHLDAWVMAIKKIGKTGKGKRAMKFRKIAQQEMEHCKDSVPCWIMPLYKVAETIKPEQEMYDYVIIDEASQLGPDAIFLLYISKNIIIVGDDKQTSPEYVGVDSNTMTPHIKRHLQGIPFSDYYGTEFSFFDHAKFFCDGVTVLREHFRCMPEIIEFSNRHFYAPDGKGLYPLKQYSENRLEPLVTVFCSNGYTEGIGARIINKPEANQIAETILTLVEDKRYSDKTIGIITLQGNQQASIIENLLLKKIGEKEFHKRKIVCGNSSSFQGDERDIIFLSLVTAHNHNRSALVKPEDERRFNVAVSRAKEQIFLFHSVQLDDLSNTNDLRYKLLDHFKNYNSYQQIFNTPIERRIGTQPEPFDSWFEVDVYNDIVSKKLSVIPNYEVAKGRYRIDMVMLLPDGTKIAIECDGDKWHGPEKHQDDIMRQKVLERCGWQFFRVRGYEYYTNRKKALEQLWNMIPNLKEKESDLISVFDLKEINTKEDTKINKTNSDEPQNTNSQIKFHQIKIHNEFQTDHVESISELNKVLRYFNLYQSGTYILTDDMPLDADYVIPIRENHAEGFLLQCYKSGHVNKVHIQVLLSRKIGKEYVNGLNKDGKLVHIEVFESEKIIGILFTENGRRKFKAHLSENISTREQLHLQGYKVIYNEFEQIEYNIFPLHIYNDISRLVFQSFTANGKPVDNNYYESEWSIIKRYSRINETQNQQTKISVSNLPFDSKVELNSTVTIRFLSNEKEIKVKLVDYPTNGAEIIDGIQIVNIMKPLGTSIKGKKIGDIVKIGDMNIEIEIIEIK